ncbi:EcoAI/FtnUII family type I restriction enzme subunit R [Oceanibaculum indicum]|uniref:Type I restriction enzyme R subunit n=1 Tax=Oceanibaculum indicum TaxID=526216 RepID=A0A420WHB3_9PROT|nr:type I restriction endonuclease subunit R [Oceanibaculum indicum]RKQ70362.1 type I restriction enzyme R subunit [Oceanibaculum indicum]
MSIHDETEAETRTNRILPVLQAAGWGRVDGSRIREEMICPGRIMAGGRRGKGLSCDYVLEYRGHKLAALEAKRASLSHREGVGQAKDYAQRLGSRFAFASNGLQWFQCDMATGAEDDDLTLPFPSPQDLWDLTFSDHNQWRLRFGEVPFETAGGKWEPRYYQHKAILAALEAVAYGKKRILLTLATGTGKTSIAFQIAWKLFHARWSLDEEADRRPRILFLADRNILADQAYNAFSAFDSNSVTRIDPEALKRRGGRPPTNASIFFTIFQTFMTGEGEPVFYDYPSDFFDFIVIDECHRGGANDESQWREILNHFAPAVQLGLTATPKRKHNADTYSYFGEPIYTYALRDGIEDGFLTPFKVRQMASTIDEYVYDPQDEVLRGEVEAGRRFTESDFNQIIEMRERELARVREFMGQMDQRQKALIFCATQAHAALVRDLVNQVKANSDPDYCHRVTANDGKVGEQYLRDFQDNDKTIPTILTTSQKLTTGVDARNVRHIVLMRPIRSIIEFKQIIGRGTRTYDGKDFFTIWDFVRAHENFNDPEWDGEPLEPDPPRPPGGGPMPPEGPQPPTWPEPPLPPEPPVEKIVVRLSDGKVRNIQFIATTTYWGPDGRPMSAAEFLNRLFGDLSKLVADEDQLREVWSDPDKRQHFIEQLADHGYDHERLEDIRRLVDAPKSDLFDVLAYVLFTSPPKTRTDRALRVRDTGLSDFDGELKQLLIGILKAYEQTGESELKARNLGHFLIARYGGVSESSRALGDTSKVRDAYLTMQKRLYKD